MTTKGKIISGVLLALGAIYAFGVFKTKSYSWPLDRLKLRHKPLPKINPSAESVAIANGIVPPTESVAKAAETLTNPGKSAAIMTASPATTVPVEVIPPVQ